MSDSDLDTVSADRVMKKVVEMNEETAANWVAKQWVVSDALNWMPAAVSVVERFKKLAADAVAKKRADMKPTSGGKRRKTRRKIRKSKTHKRKSNKKMRRSRKSRRRR